MNKENFRVLKEIVSLLQEVSKRNESLAQEKSRITKIQAMRERSQVDRDHYKSRLINIKETLAKMEQETDKLSNSIDKANNALLTAKNEKELQLAQKQKDKNTLELNKSDNMAFELMEEVEKLDQEISDCNQFLSGSEKTVKEISKEVEDNNLPVIKEIEVYKGRIFLLQESLPSDVIDKLNRTIKKELTHGPLTKIESNSCFICRFKLTKVDQDQIEQHLKFKSCSSCQRIFIPNSSLY